VNRLPFRPPDVEQRDIGLIADFERTEILVPVHAAGTVDCQHLDRRFGTKHLGVETSLVQSANDQKGLPNRIEIVARHGRIRPQRHGQARSQAAPVGKPFQRIAAP
jgi:hypothetical protein